MESYNFASVEKKWQIFFDQNKIFKTKNNNN